MAEVIGKVGPCTLQLRTEGTHFDALVRSIVYQQLSGKAAATIHGRVKALFTSEAPLPPQLSGANHDVLRGIDAAFAVLAGWRSELFDR